MAPKKKGNKKAQDDWEADLGESVVPQNDGVDGAASPTEEAAAPPEEALGGLMASLQRRNKKKKKNQQQDWIEGEDPLADGDDQRQAPVDLASKAPEEANFEDDDVFAGNYKTKGKAAAEKKEAAAEEKKDEGPRVKTKAEKEKEKKEKEKQRKKELVSLALEVEMADPERVRLCCLRGLPKLTVHNRPRRRRQRHPQRPMQRPRRRLHQQHLRLSPKPLPLLLPPVARRRSSTPLSLYYRNTRKSDGSGKRRWLV
jgi:hypothetical protein